jgi:hypothetical protein
MSIRTTPAPGATMPGEPPRRSRRTLVAVVLAVAVIAVAALVALTSTRDRGAPVATRTTDQPPGSVGTSPTLPPDPQAAIKAEVIAAYSQSFKALIVVGRQPSASPDDPRLSEHTSGPALIAKQRAIRDNNAKGLVYVGDAELHPTVVDLTADSATVIECALDRTALIQVSTQKTVIDAGPNEGIASTSKMKLEGGVWRVTDFKNENRPCVPPAA